MYTRIMADIKEAMKNKDTIKRDCLKMVLNNARNINKEKNPVDTPTVIPDDIIIQSLKREIKQIEQTLCSIQGVSGSKYNDFYQNNTLKMAILNGYLPTQMTKEDVESAVYSILSNREFGSFGEKMKACMSELKGKADNKLIKEVVENYK